jgi:hypothetical protein
MVVANPEYMAMEANISMLLCKSYTPILPLLLPGNFTIEAGAQRRKHTVKGSGTILETLCNTHVMIQTSIDNYVLLLELRHTQVFGKLSCEQNSKGDCHGAQFLSAAESLCVLACE